MDYKIKIKWLTPFLLHLKWLRAWSNSRLTCFHHHKITKKYLTTFYHPFTIAVTTEIIFNQNRPGLLENVDDGGFTSLFLFFSIHPQKMLNWESPSCIKYIFYVRFNVYSCFFFASPRNCLIFNPPYLICKSNFILIIKVNMSDLNMELCRILYGWGRKTA